MNEELTVTSHEQDGRILSGVGVSAEDLAATMDRHTPEDRQVEPTPAVPATIATVADAPPSPVEVPPADRNPDGTFKKVSRGQKRFDDLTREREDARREAAALKAENDQLRARASQSQEPAKAAPAAPPATPAHSPTRAKPTEDQIGTAYHSYAEFVEDLADWKSEQRLAAIDFDARIRTSIEADRASRSFQDRVSAVVDAGKKAYANFDAVLQNPVQKYPDAFLAKLADLPGAEHVYYQLATNKAVADRITAVLRDPIALGMEVAKLVPASTGATPASPVRTVAPPPAPYQPVAGGSKTTVTPSADLAKGFDFDKSGYREQRARERGSSRR